MAEFFKGVALAAALIIGYRLATAIIALLVSMLARRALAQMLDEPYSHVPFFWQVTPEFRKRYGDRVRIKVVYAAQRLQIIHKAGEPKNLDGALNEFSVFHRYVSTANFYKFGTYSMKFEDYQS